MYKIPSYEECVDICNKYPPKTFYEKKKICQGYNFSFFSYRLAEYRHFLESNAFEMKGLTFMHYNGVSKPYLMFNKFWELNQYPEFKYENFKNKPVKKIMVKEDGNLITFIKLPNNQIVSRLKEGFNSSFNRTANKIIAENKKYYDFINWCIENEIVPLFELVGENRIILKYDNNELILLNLRNNLTGEYIDNIPYNMDGITTVKTEDYTFDEIIKLSETLENKEGWVVQFQDDTFLKIKTKWYFEFSDYLLKKYGIRKS